MSLNDYVLMGFALLGFLFRIFEHLYKDPNMTLNRFYKDRKNRYRTILSFISIMILFSLKDDLKSLFNIQYPDYKISIKLISIGIGYFNYRLVSVLFNIFYALKKAAANTDSDQDFV